MRPKCATPYSSACTSRISPVAVRMKLLPWFAERYTDRHVETHNVPSVAYLLDVAIDMTCSAGSPVPAATKDAPPSTERKNLPARVPAKTTEPVGAVVIVVTGTFAGSPVAVVQVVPPSCDRATVPLA